MNQANIKKLIKEVQAISQNDLSPEKKTRLLEKMKRNFSKHQGTKKALIKTVEIRKVYQKMVANKEIKPSEKLEDFFCARRIRSLSGVVVVAVLTKPANCKGKCLYCPTEKTMPKSYLSNEPAVMRAIKTNFNPYQQTQTRLRALKLNGHPIDKIELIVMGGTFSYFSKNYQKWFIKECFRAANDFPFIRKELSTDRQNYLLALQREKKINEQAKTRIVGLTLETRPDCITFQEIKKFRLLGATRVELGVQNIFDDVLEKNQRGHTTKETILATKLLKDAGFKVGYHLMPGLWGSTLQKDFKMFKKIFSDQSFQPDLIKIYPCVVTENSKLFHYWRKRKYQPLNNNQTKKLIIKIKKIIPPYVRVSRLIRDIPEESIVAGPNISNLRQIIQKEKGVICRCIRCREVKGAWKKNEKIVLKRTDYFASEGKEIFLQYSSPKEEKLYAILRLRIPSLLNKNHFLKELRLTGLIRELHTYGKLTKINQQNVCSPQHIGLGKKLVKKAEEIAKKEFNLSKIAVIAGVGVREYYQKLGYHLEGEYMIKKI